MSCLQRCGKWTAGPGYTPGHTERAEVHDKYHLWQRHAGVMNRRVCIVTLGQEDSNRGARNPERLSSGFHEVGVVSGANGLLFRRHRRRPRGAQQAGVPRTAPAGSSSTPTLRIRLQIAGFALLSLKLLRTVDPIA